jgi:competence protein ComEC
VVAVVWFLTAAIVAGVFQNEFLLAGIVGALALRAVFTGAGRLWAWLALALVCALVGAAGSARVRADSAHVVNAVGRHGAAPMLLVGYVASFPASGPFGTSFLYETDVAGRGVRLAMRAAFFDIDYGDSFVCRARVSARPGDAYLLSREAAGSARVRLADTECAAIDPRGTPHGRRFWSWHRAARTRLSRALANDAALPLGLLLGERGYLDRRLRDAVIRLGIAHLLALSGMHLTVIALIAIVLARALPRGRDLLILFALTAYVGMVGDVQSLTRAYVMALLMILARALARPVRPVDCLGKALFVMLLVSPVAILSVGLQLSFAATLAVLMAVERIPFLRGGRALHSGGLRRLAHRLAGALAGALVISVAVEIVIAPLQFYHFGQISVVGPVATALFLFPVTVVQVLAMVAVALAGVPLFGALSADCLAAASRGTIAAVLAAAAHAPDPFVSAGPRIPLYYMALLIAWRFPRRHAAWAAAALLMGGAFVAR